MIYCYFHICLVLAASVWPTELRLFEKMELKRGGVWWIAVASRCAIVFHCNLPACIEPISPVCWIFKATCQNLTCRTFESWMETITGIRQSYFDVVSSSLSFLLNWRDLFRNLAGNFLVGPVQRFQNVVLLGNSSNKTTKISRKVGFSTLKSVSPMSKKNWSKFFKWQSFCLGLRSSSHF